MVNEISGIMLKFQPRGQNKLFQQEEEHSRSRSFFFIKCSWSFFRSRKITSIFVINTEFLGHPLWLSWYRTRLQWGKPRLDPWVGKIPWSRERPPTPLFWPGEFHGLYSPCGRKESDTTERLSLYFTSQLDLLLNCQCDRKECV